MVTIACPEDCPHLGREIYQQDRRRRDYERTVEPLHAWLRESTRSPAEQEFALSLAVEIYAATRTRFPFDAGTVPGALEALAGRFGSVLLAGGAETGLVEHLERRCDTVEELGAEVDGQSVDRAAVLRRVATRLGDDKEFERYRSLVERAFDPIDLVRDLGFDRALVDGDTGEPTETRRPSGLIVPPDAET